MEFVALLTIAITARRLLASAISSERFFEAPRSCVRIHWHGPMIAPYVELSPAPLVREMIMLSVSRHCGRSPSASAPVQMLRRLPT